MSNKNGIKVFAPFVAPEGTPVAYASDIAGCNRIVATKADLLTIPASLLEVGMSVFVQDEAKDYRLANKSEVPVASDWTSAAPTAADIKVAEDKTLADVLITKEEVATKIADATNAAGETYQTKADALAAKTALEESIHAVSTAGLSEETKQDIQAAKDAAATLAGFQQTLDQTKTELTQKVEEAKQAALTQEDKTAIASIADVKSTAEAAKAKAEELEPKVTANKEAVDGLKTKVEALPDSDAVDAKITTAKEAINNSIDLVKDSVAALKTVVQGSEDGATKGLDAKITEAKEELEGKITELGTKVDGIHVPDTSTLATKEELNSVKEKVAPHMVKLIEDIILTKTSDGSKHIFIKADTNSYPVGDQKEDVVLLEGSSSTEIKASDYNTYTGYLRFAANDISTTANLKLKITTQGEVYIQDIGVLYLMEGFTAIENTSPTLVVFEKSDKDSDETNKKYIKPVALNKDTGDYTFIIDLKSGVGNPTNICVGFTNAEINNISDSCKEFAQLPKAVSINGQFGMFKTIAETDIFRAFKMNVADGSYDKFRTPTATFPNDFKYYELKNPLTPDGQNDTYIVTYHRPFNI